LTSNTFLYAGKTALAREISRALRARTPKIVSAPELLDRWVGGSEKLVRQLFADAEAELAACNNDPTKSALHVIVIDEIDAVFRKRSSSEDSGEATRSSVVNQILAKLDGVKAISNILVIGMTNRRELLDEALLRPGRLEVQIEIPLPDKTGRREILNVHFNALRQRGRLSRQLCNAIDGVPDSVPQINSTKLFARQAVERVLDPIVPITPSSVLNLATDTISSNIGAATNAITDNLMLASDVMALDSFSFPPGAIITDCVRLVRRTINKRRNSKRGKSDGALSMTVTSDGNESRLRQRRNRIRHWFRRIIPPLRVKHYDLASDEVTGGFSGADIAGLVRCAGSLALARARREGYGIDGLLITLEDVKAAVKEVRPKV
jgi:SpoVK/Ycf46/Vps4 family AAA+-type ATPase